MIEATSNYQQRASSVVLAMPRGPFAAFPDSYSRPTVQQPQSGSLDVAFPPEDRPFPLLLPDFHLYPPLEGDFLAGDAAVERATRGKCQRTAEQAFLRRGCGFPSRGIPSANFDGEFSTAKPQTWLSFTRTLGTRATMRNLGDTWLFAWTWRKFEKTLRDDLKLKFIYEGTCFNSNSQFERPSTGSCCTAFRLNEFCSEMEHGILTRSRAE